MSLAEVKLDLEETVVTADRKVVVYKLDKKTISASSDIFASGGTAVDILESTPSIRVDADGEITFRGSSGFTVYVNGKPAISEGSLALQQIPASQIEDIEIITTPSARYETNGDVGIINVILKKNDTPGTNGVATVSGSTLGSYNIDFLLNLNKASHRWYFGGTAFDNRTKSDFNQTKTTDLDGIRTVSNSHGPRTGVRQRYTAKAGWEYDKENNRFNIELEGGYTNHSRTGDMNYTDQRSGLEDSRANYNSFDIYAIHENIISLSTDFEHKFNDKGHKISAKTYLKYDWNALEYYESNMYDQAHVRVDGSRAYEAEHRWNGRGYLDYTLPYSSTGKFEAGYEFYLCIEEGDYSIKFWDRDKQQYNWRDDLYNDYYYNRTMNSIYAQWTDSAGPFSFQAGLRADHRLDYLNITMKDCSRNIKKLELFPSAHVSYSTENHHVFTLGYSYRTNRPNIWNLEPYITYEDYYTAMVGNPDIKPEFINAYEFTYRKNIGERHSISATLFHRDRKDTKDRIRVAYLPGVTLDSLANVGCDKSSGIELNGQFKVAKNWGLVANASGYYYDFKVYDPSLGRDTDSFNYELYLGNTFTLSPTTRLQFDANVVGPAVSSQGRQNTYYYFNLSARQQLLKKRVTAVLAFRDFLGTARYNSTREANSLLSVTKIRPVYPAITLTLSYTFNDYKLKEAKKAAEALFEGSDF